MGRFLIYFSYLGHRYSGVQIQTKVLSNGKPIPTIQDVLTRALKRLHPSNDIQVKLSSRTDKGVHALRTSCHVDLQHRNEGCEFSPGVIKNVVNYYLSRDLHEIRILEAHRVKDDFHARLYAVERKYVYRLAHPANRLQSSEDEMSNKAKELQEHEHLSNELMQYTIWRGRRNKARLPYGDHTASLDSYRVAKLGVPLNISKLVSAADVLSGIHNFSSFTSEKKLYSKEGRVSHPVKMVTIGVRRGNAFGSGVQPEGMLDKDHFEFWDIHVQASSFLYKMVRRLVGAMVLHARDKISIADLQDILNNPRQDFPFASGMGMPECGLFLQDVVYRKEDLQCPDFKSSNDQNESAAKSTDSDIKG